MFYTHCSVCGEPVKNDDSIVDSVEVLNAPNDRKGFVFNGFRHLSCKRGKGLADNRYPNARNVNLR